ncbi:hypothetical protein BDR26DRAFT_9467 [Obelidium mucronatum]|nr:hypothetical protein BDR26DRAFT_9467 [Obelidium mucronatum]
MSEKMFKCTVAGCDKSFNTKPHLARHSLKHTTARQYRCKVPGCTSSFYRTDALSQHERAHVRRYEQEHGCRLADAPLIPMNLWCPTESVVPNTANPTLFIHTTSPPNSSQVPLMNPQVQSWLLAQLETKKRKEKSYIKEITVPTPPSPPVSTTSDRKPSISFLCD